MINKAIGYLQEGVSRLSTPSLANDRKMIKLFKLVLRLSYKKFHWFSKMVLRLSYKKFHRFGSSFQDCSDKLL